MRETPFQNLSILTHSRICERSSQMREALFSGTRFHLFLASLDTSLPPMVQSINNSHNNQFKPLNDTQVHTTSFIQFTLQFHNPTHQFHNNHNMLELGFPNPTKEGFHFGVTSTSTPNLNVASPKLLKPSST